MDHETTVRWRCFRMGLTAMCSAMAAFVGACASPGDPPPVGSWLHHGPRHIRGRGENVLLEIAVGDEGPRATRSVTLLPNVGRGEAVSHRGPQVPVRVDGCWLRCGDEAWATFRLEGDRLVFPALVEETPGTWIYGTDGPGGKVLRWACADDPRRVSAGPAHHPNGERAGAQPQRYRATIDPATHELLRLDFFDADDQEPSTTFVFESRWGVEVLKTWPPDVHQRYFEAVAPR